ncbi:polymer-forming cytoskeletal protein [Thermaerobacillus caldiproteolyticus]|uniref:Cytoskeletal protein CcmA (Bactofilin family) n=1 Tax=Thermaerobacillus caldiproteolyticus TaxID=247480 RepID=A0A7V9Z9M1_9BACL|nr:polymer-forming cytoskeletal protein [Anoxybacillus caldiproteolyticus]MBA2876597.1 cytoskeletal protein CcmA (bactofilin family) [Anoxybacillus caldiproteolyticus]
MERPDLVIAGVGNASGGVYNLVKIAGHGKLHGDIDCIDFNIQGNATIHGNVKAKVTNISGRAHMIGTLRSEQIKIQGNASIHGDIECKEIRFHGRGDVKGNVMAEEVCIHGETEIVGDCAAEVFDASGSFTIGGLLNAGNIHIKLFGNCRAKEIGGEKIEVKQQGMTFFKKLFLHVGLTAESIEGDEIYVEHTKAKVVRGNQVIIGPGCDIELVEYKDAFQCDKGAKVGSYKKI